MSNINGIESYNGGKNGAGVYQTIINHIRPCDIYIELCLGSGGVLTRLKAARIVVGCDTSDTVIKSWRSTPAFSHVKLYWGSCIDFLDGLVKGYYTIGTGLEKSRIAFDTDDRVVINIDPPYPHFTRRGGDKKLYGQEWSNSKHIHLLTLVVELAECWYDNIDFLISTYPNDLYETFLKSPNWYHIDFEAMTRKGLATERLYMNYNPAEITELHDYSYLGEDYRQRENLTRQKKRMLRKFGEMPVLQRKALLNTLNEKYL